MMLDETVAWFEKEWLDTDARALGVYVTLLIFQFRVRYGTDVPVLSRDEGLLRLRLSPYIALILHDEQERREAFEAGKEFLEALVTHTDLTEYEAAMDRIELAFYERFKDAYLRHVNKTELTGAIADTDVLTLIKTFLRDVASNRFSKGKITSAGSCILLMPATELIELYGLSKDDENRFIEILRNSGIMFFDIVPAPVLTEELRGSLS